jgi:phosphonate metabolism protein (transferase hexapeptide repeat family)
MPVKTLSTTPLIHPTAEVRNSKLGAYTEVGARTRLLEVVLGDYSYIVNDGEVAYTTFGKFCSIAAMARINPGNHPMARATQSHITYRASAYFPGERDEEEFFAWRRASAVIIGHDVWIGHGAIILPGRSVGTGAVVAAGAVVTKNVEPYAIVAGNPARVIRQRFPAAVARRLEHWPGGTGITTDCGPPCLISVGSRSRISSKNTRRRRCSAVRKCLRRSATRRRRLVRRVISRDIGASRLLVHNRINHADAYRRRSRARRGPSRGGEHSS